MTAPRTRQARRRRARVRRRVGRLLALVGALLVALATLTPQGNRVNPDVGHWCVVCGRLGGADVVNNVVLFVPLGLGLGLAGMHRLRALAVVLAATTCVELLQATVVSGRYATISDVLTNTVGGALGWLLATRRARLLRPSPHAARYLAAGAGATWLAVLLGTAWALQRDASTGPASAQPVPPAPTSYSWFHGRVPRATLDGATVSTADAYPVSVTRALPATGTRVDAWITPTATAQPRLAYFVVVYDADRRAQLMIGQHGRDLVFHTQLRTADARLRQPSIVVSNAFPEPDAVARDSAVAATVLHVYGETRGHAWVAGIERDGRVAEHALRLAPTHGWALFAPFVHGLDARAPWFTGAWLWALLLPAGYWAARCGAPRADAPRTWVAAAAMGLLLVVGLALLPALAGFGSARWSEWAASTAGIACGWAAGARRLRRERLPGVPSCERDRPRVVRALGR
jgi:hypothetical protein